MTSRDELYQLNGNLMNSTSMRKSIGIGIVLLVCLPLSTGCTSERSASRVIEATTAHAQAEA